MKSVVTGAAGFVGRHLVSALRTRGDDVVASDVAPDSPWEDVRYERADLRERDALDALVAGADVVFHSASIVHTRKTKVDTVFAVNLQGTKNLIAACKKAGVARLVYVSSASAVYEGSDIEDGDETLPYSSISQAPYADSKIAAEKEVLAADDEAGLRTCAIRPHVVFGPGDTRFLPAIIARARAGKLKLWVGRDRKLSDFTYVGNLVDALLLADETLARGAAGGQAYFVTNGEPRAFVDFVGQVLEQLDLPPIKGHVPYALAYGVAAVKETIDGLRGRPIGEEDGLSRFAIRYLCTHHYFSIDKARRELGYEPAVSLDDGIARTCQALR
jgi:nucleoside-diphosphate-sugar epimerase